MHGNHAEKDYTVFYLLWHYVKGLVVLILIHESDLETRADLQ